MLDLGGTEGLALMVYVLDILSIVSNKLGKAYFKAMMSWATTVDGSVSLTWGLRDLSTDFGFMTGR